MDVVCVTIEIDGQPPPFQETKRLGLVFRRPHAGLKCEIAFLFLYLHLLPSGVSGGRGVPGLLRTPVRKKTATRAKKTKQYRRLTPAHPLRNIFVKLLVQWRTDKN